MTDPDKPDSDPEQSDLDESALDRALDGAFDAAGDAANRENPAPTPSVIERIGEITGQAPSVSLREDGPAAHTPILKPLTASDGIAQDTGKYTVHGMLGQGGVGAVHRGHDTDLGRDVAMKFLHEKYKDEPSILHRFVEEAQIGGQLQHPGIVPVYDLGMSDGKPFFTMKMVKGQTLAKKLADRTSPATDRRTFLAIFEDICQTMAYAHARGVVHRDLKPANVMIGSFGEVQVVDWGMGKVLQSGGVADEKVAAERRSQLSVIETVRSAGHGTQSVMGSVMGTPAYMPPEQARGDVDAMDERSDVFALGAILCEILTGQPPYVGEAGNLISMAAMGELADAHERLKTCGAEQDLVELAMRYLMPAPAARPQSAEAVAKAVHGHLAAAEQRAHDATVRALAMKRTQKLGVALTVVIAAGLATSLWFWRAAAESATSERQAAQSEREARELADSRAQEAASARDEARANLDNFNRLSHVVRLEAAKALEKELHPAWPSKSDQMRSWLANEAKDLTAALPELRATLTALEASALPLTDAAKAEARRLHLRGLELTNLENELRARLRAQSVRSGVTKPLPLALNEAALPTTHHELEALARPLVDPDRTAYGREAEGLALARRAVSLAPRSGDDRAMVTNTLAWALFANGLDEEALTTSKAALQAAAEEKRVEYSGYVRKLEAAIAAATGTDAEKALAKLRDEVDALDSEISVSAARHFEDNADRFLHSTLRQLAADIEAFDEQQVAAVRQRLAWSERVEELSVTRYDERWKEARLAIIRADGTTASELYREIPIDLSPQMGLVPLGMNPATKLWEFYHLRSAWDGKSDPAELEIPTHREDGSIEVTGDTGVVFALLPGGTFIMGAQKTDQAASNYDENAEPDEAPREVDIEPFFLARHEMTQGQWTRLWSGEEGGRRPSYYRPGYVSTRITAAHPVEQVSWHVSADLCDSHELSLPTEAQWEYACRSTTTTPYWFDFAEFGNHANIADATADAVGVAWTCESWADGHVVHAPVGTYGANLFGLHDMHGNVWEWCREEYRNSSFRLSRGGSFSDPAFGARAAFRNVSSPAIRSNTLGLRPARLVME